MSRLKESMPSAPALLRGGEVAIGSAQVSGASVLASSNRIVSFLVKNRQLLSRCIFDTVATWEKYNLASKKSGLGADSYAIFNFGAAVDCLMQFFRSGNEAYRQLFIGELFKIAHSPQLMQPEQHANRAVLGQGVHRHFLKLAAQSLASVDLNRLESELEHALRILTAPTRTRIDFLCVGDCLMLDIVGFLGIPCTEIGIELNPTFIGSHNPVELHRILLNQARDAFALVFYSPFSHTFNADFNRTLTCSRLIC